MKMDMIEELNVRLGLYRADLETYKAEGLPITAGLIAELGVIVELAKRIKEAK